MLFKSRSQTRDCERLSTYPVTARSPRRASAGVGRATGPTAVHAFLHGAAWTVLGPQG